MKKQNFIVVLVTAKNKSEARKLAKGLIKEKLAACVNILDNIESFFWWEGRVDKAREVLLVIKSEARRISNITKVVKSLHSYTCPEIIALPIVGGSKDYLKWIRDSVK